MLKRVTAQLSHIDAYGWVPALLINRLEFLIKHHQTNGKAKFKDGKAFAYHSTQQLAYDIRHGTTETRKAISKLRKLKILETEQFGKSKGTMTLYFHLNEELLKSTHATETVASPMQRKPMDHATETVACTRRKPSHASIYNKEGYNKEGEEEESLPQKYILGDDEIWEAYSKAFEERYGVKPFKDEISKEMCSRLERELGKEEGAEAVVHYVSIGKRHYINRAHSLRVCLDDLSGIVSHMRKLKINEEHLWD